MSERVLRIVGPAAMFLVVLAAWYGFIAWRDVPAMILPAPDQIATALIAGFRSGLITKHLWITAKEVVAGYVLGVGLGILLGAPIALSRICEIVFYPYVLALQTMPKVALAPLMMIWVGYGIESKIIITMIVALFPVLVNVIIGLRTIDQDRINLVRALKGDAWAEFRYVRLPGAAPFIFAGMKTAVVLSLLGAITAEFVGAEAGLGYLMSQLMFRLDTPGVFSVLIVLAVIGIVLFMLADWLHRRIVFWDSPDRSRLDGR